jgi:hypothetical protein
LKSKKNGKDEKCFELSKIEKFSLQKTRFVSCRVSDGRYESLFCTAARKGESGQKTPFFCPLLYFYAAVAACYIYFLPLKKSAPFFPDKNGGVFYEKPCFCTLIL